MAQEGSKGEINKEKEEEFMIEKDAQVVAKEKLEEIDLGSSS